MTDRGGFRSSLAQIPGAASSIFAAIIIGGLALRVCLAIAFPDIYHPDEVFQTLEPAHRLVTGWGGMASWHPVVAVTWHSCWLDETGRWSRCRPPQLFDSHHDRVFANLS